MVSNAEAWEVGWEACANYLQYAGRVTGLRIFPANPYRIESRPPHPNTMIGKP